MKREESLLNILFSLHRFLEQCGSNLVCLRLSCCQFVDCEVIQSVSQYCPNLEGLSSTGCSVTGAKNACSITRPDQSEQRC